MCIFANVQSECIEMDLEEKGNLIIFWGMQLDITNCDIASEYNQQNCWTVDTTYQNLFSDYVLLSLHVFVQFPGASPSFGEPRGVTGSVCLQQPGFSPW